MTREEAVNRFKGIRESFSISIAQSKFYPSKAELNELCDMAIEALSADAVSLTGTMKYLTKPHNYCEVVRCKDCRHLDVWNLKTIYAVCSKHGITFEPFEDDTRTHFCAWGERGEK